MANFEKATQLPGRYVPVDLPTAAALIDSRRVRPERRLGQVFWAGVVLSLLCVFAFWAVSNPAFEWDTFAEYFTQERILQGLMTTIWLTVVVVAISIVFGLALAAFRISNVPILVAMAWCYVWVFRSIPVLVQLLLWFNIGYFVPPFRVTLWSGEVVIVNTNDLLTATGAAILGLSLHGIALAGEIIRGGILGVAPGQAEASRVLGLSERYTFTRIVFPQALRSTVPALSNMFIEQLKGTSIVSVLAVHDLLYSAQEVYATNYKVVPLLMVATVWYVIVTSVLSICQYSLEKQLAKSNGHGGRFLRTEAPRTGHAVIAEDSVVRVGA